VKGSRGDTKDHSRRHPSPVQKKKLNFRIEQFGFIRVRNEKMLRTLTMIWCIRLCFYMHNAANQRRCAFCVRRINMLAIQPPTISVFIIVPVISCN
jgi:hypothetical protein